MEVLLLIPLAFGLRWVLNQSSHVRGSNRWALEQEIEAQTRRLHELQALRSNREYNKE